MENSIKYMKEDLERAVKSVGESLRQDYTDALFQEVWRREFRRAFGNAGLDMPSDALIDQAVFHGLTPHEMATGIVLWQAHEARTLGAAAREAADAIDDAGDWKPYPLGLIGALLLAGALWFMGGPRLLVFAFLLVLVFGGGAYALRWVREQ